jgi:ATP/maltotriose-dependent transcriptional regulator MalT
MRWPELSDPEASVTERSDMSAGAGWLIETKFSPAARGRRQIERDRILAAIAGDDHRLVVVQAAAGFGKSTLLGQWAARAEEGGATVAWLNLDEDDREPD